METFGMFEAKTHFSALIARVKQGEEIEISQRGETVAIISPANKKRRVSPEELMARFDALQAGFKGPLSTWDELKSLRDEGRKY